jgi:leucine-zipper-like transcriptional regulator 1
METTSPVKPASLYIFALNMVSHDFKSIDVGNVLVMGSWNRGILWRNSFVVLGNAALDKNTDYAMRRSNFNHVIFIDLEVYGIYSPPPTTTSSFAKDFALSMLSQKSFSDMDVVTKDNFRIHVNSRILARRWPMFTEVLNTCIYGSPNAGELARRPSASSAVSLLLPQNQHPSLPVVERPRMLYLPLKHDEAVACLSYLYTNSLPSDLDVSILCSLLVLTKRFAPGLERLEELVCDALHQQLDESNVGKVIEASALTGCTALQIHAMLVMRMVADLKVQALRRREELRNKESLPALGNGEENESPVGSLGEEVEKSRVESSTLGNSGVAVEIRGTPLLGATHVDED